MRRYTRELAVFMQRHEDPPGRRSLCLEILAKARDETIRSDGFARYFAQFARSSGDKAIHTIHPQKPMAAYPHRLSLFGKATELQSKNRRLQARRREGAIRRDDAATAEGWRTIAGG